MTNNKFKYYLNQQLLHQLEIEIGKQFTDHHLLLTAFTHRSFVNEYKNQHLDSNERLEFIGDSILSMITSLYLFDHYPFFAEGAYTDIKASLVKTDTLAEAAKKLNLGKFLYLSKGEDDHSGRNNISLLADCFEALIAVIFIQFGYPVTAQFIEKVLIKDSIDLIIENKSYLPAKNKLQEYYQEKLKRLPLYRVISEFGPQHNKEYIIGIYNKKQLVAKGKGKTKKQAEENAAKQAIQNLKI